ncbi:MAG: hypothetical protein M3Z24_15025 [Chloroflexota bacterium]|nr:hypothetical protein [Chloroflexota bacterium]
MTISGYRWTTIAEAFEQICNNQEPWVAIGNFLNDWWRFAAECRRELIETPLAPAPTSELNRWAAFCAGMVEWLCQQENVPCPAWTEQECYVLSEPWFYYEDWESRAWLLATTPVPFKVRNLFVGDQMFLNKWELKRTSQITHQWTAQEMGLG